MAADGFRRISALWRTSLGAVLSCLKRCWRFAASLPKMAADWLRRLGLLSRYVMALALGAGLAFASPFNLSDYTDQGLRSIFMRIASFTLMDESRWVAVAILNDRALQEEELTWPLDAVTHLALLEGYARLDPSLIFIDLLFLDERDDPTMPALASGLARLADDTPLLIAAPPRTEPGTPLAIAPIAALEAHPNIHFVSVESRFSNRIPGAYDLRQDQRDSAALRAYAMTCEHRRKGCVDLSELEVIDPVWPPPSAHACEQHPERCAQVPRNALSRATRIFFSGLLQNLGLSPPAQLNPVGLYPVNAFDAFELADGDFAARQRSRVEGRVLMYGQSLLGLGDVEHTPLYGAQPGIMTHAVAYENLMQRDRSSLSAASALSNPKVGISVLAACLAALGYAAWRAAKSQDRSVSRLIICAVAFAALLIAGAIYLADPSGSLFASTDQYSDLALFLMGFSCLTLLGAACRQAMTRIGRPHADRLANLVAIILFSIAAAGVFVYAFNLSPAFWYGLLMTPLGALSVFRPASSR